MGPLELHNHKNTGNWRAQERSLTITYIATTVRASHPALVHGFCPLESATGLAAGVGTHVTEGEAAGCCFEWVGAKWLCADPSRGQQDQPHGWQHLFAPFAEDEGGKAWSRRYVHYDRKSQQSHPHCLLRGHRCRWKTLGKRAFRVARVDPQSKKACPKLEVLDNSALTLKSHDAGSLYCWVHHPPSHAHWQDVSTREPVWTVLVDIIQDYLSDMDWLMIQQMIQARVIKKQKVLMMWHTSDTTHLSRHH